MRILVAYDGSPAAEQAVALAGRLAGPSASTLLVAGAVEFDLPYYTGVRHERAARPEVDPQLIVARQQQVSDAVRELKREGHSVDGVVLRGRAATVLADKAVSFRADLVITGSRGHGPVLGLLLGSVAAELVDTAGCPVLVARGTDIRRIVIAVDGSPAADAAVSLLETWPIVEDGRVLHVLSVAQVMDPVEFGIAPPRYHAAARRHADVVAEQKERHTRIADETAARLRAVGHPAHATMRTGRAAAEIIALASEIDADLIVMGSRGQTGIARIVLGSVARKVLNTSVGSVLIARAP